MAGWLPITWGDAPGNDTDPRNSFWVTNNAPRVRRAQSLVLVASVGVNKRANEFVPARLLGNAIRVVANVVSRKPGSITLNFTTYSSSLGDIDPPPAGRVEIQATPFKINIENVLAGFRLTESNFQLASLAILPRGHGTYALSVKGETKDVTKTPDGKFINRVYDFVLNVTGNSVDQGKNPTSVSFERFLRVTHAVTPAKKQIALPAVLRERASAYPLKERDNIRPIRPFVTDAVVDIPLSGNDAVFQEDNDCFRVISAADAPFVGAPPPGMAPPLMPPPPAQTIPNPNSRPLDARRTEVASTSAYAHAATLFARLTGYGFDPRQYFKCFQMPLELVPDSPIQPGARDGNAVNAQVTVDDIGGDPQAPSDEWLKKRAHLQVRFAHADESARLLDSTGQTRAKYLSMATDSRWAWHEFGHVLIAASTGALELPFVHSIGDAISAILHDVNSTLAKDPTWRGASYPWVELPRRHDRRADSPWCWHGGLHEPQRFWSGTPTQSPYKGYTTEQILSSTLFVLYRALGGDSKKLPERVCASEYTVYLVMRALTLLGPWNLVLADSVQHLVAALLDADAATDKSMFGLGGTAGANIRKVFSDYKMPLRVLS